MSFYLMVFQGGGAVGSAVMGVIATRAGLSATLAIAAAGLALGPPAGRHPLAGRRAKITLTGRRVITMDGRMLAVMTGRRRSNDDGVHELAG
jgi:hypothetical protein